MVGLAHLRELCVRRNRKSTDCSSVSDETEASSQVRRSTGHASFLSRWHRRIGLPTVHCGRASRVLALTFFMIFCLCRT